MSSLKYNHSRSRKLLVIPIVHTEIDMGELSDSVKSAYLKKMGLQAWKRKKELINRFWNDLEKVVRELDIPYLKTKIYQDGLPVCEDGREIQIIERLASSGSRNHLLLKKLIEKGAKALGTESPELLMMEYNLALKTLDASGTPSKSDNLEMQSGEILRRRDAFIAERINGTLKSGETGILFVGSLHNVVPMLDPDIEVVSLTKPLASS